MPEKPLHLTVCPEEDLCAFAAAGGGPARPAANGAATADPTWTRFAAADEIPLNEMKAFTVAGLTVLVAHTPDAFLAVQALCPHELVPLAMTGQLAGGTLICLEHLWQFDLRTGAPMGEAEEGLRVYPLKSEDGQLYIAV